MDGMLREVVRRLCDHVAERHGEIVYKEGGWDEYAKMDLPGYFSPSGVMVDTSYIADILMVLSVMPDDERERRRA